MKITPLLFRTDMVKALLDGRKTMTRRIVKCDHKITDIGTPDDWNNGRAHPNMKRFEDWGDKHGYHLFNISSGSTIAMQCQHGQKGDLIWVKERWAHDAPTDDDARRSVESDGMNGGVYYYADCNEFDRVSLKWKSSRYMFKWASRITLKITDVRVERLQEITEDDSLKEGIDMESDYASLCINIESAPYPSDLERGSAAITVFKKLWDSINRKKYPWSSNPWVWVISFDVIQQNVLEVINREK